MATRKFGGTYSGERLNRVAFPMGGLGAGMICLEGTGCLSHVSVRNRPEVFHEPYWYAAICVKGDPNVARVLEGPVPKIKRFGFPGAGNGAADRTYGLPRFTSASFKARFPFATVTLKDANLPVGVRVTGWSPFVPNDADACSLPAALMEYRLRNTSDEAQEWVLSFNARNFMAAGPEDGFVRRLKGGFVLGQAPTDEQPWRGGELAVTTDAPGAAVNAAWFRGGWFDSQTIAWRDVESGELVDREPWSEGKPSPGASLFVPVALEPGQSRTVKLMFTWYVPRSDLRKARFGHGDQTACVDRSCCDGPDYCYQPWYAGAFKSIEDVTAHIRKQYANLRRAGAAFRDCFYDTTLPPEAIEAVAANLTILKSPTVLRQTDGRIWAWEGCGDDVGCCEGSCTHVWNYAQALPHLLSDLERTLRETEFLVCQDDRGHQAFRAALPIAPTGHHFHAAADGQLGGIIKAYRDWRISGDTEWLGRLWPRVRASLDYCIETWDPDRTGTLVEPHHNTYDIEFWGPDSMCSSFYLGALRAADRMGEALGEDVSAYRALADRGRAALETTLFNGEYFHQQVRWRGLRAGDPTEAHTRDEPYTPEARALLECEGPKYQYGAGCLSDGVLGAWMAALSGIEDVLDGDKVASHLAAVHKYNFREDLSDHVNTQRPSYAFGEEGGLLLCSWPRGEMPSLPMVYANEVWTGIEYQVASHLISVGLVEEGLEIVRAARDRYDGAVRNPFNEYECGHWYARAMASYALLQALGGARYDAVEKVLYLAPRVEGDFRAFLCTAGGYGTVGLAGGEPFLDVKAGRIDVVRIEYRPVMFSRDGV